MLKYLRYLLTSIFFSLHISFCNKLINLAHLENTLQKLFEKLRDNYRRCLRKREKLTRSGAENKKLPSCEYFAQLSFLKDIMTGRTTCSNIPPFMSPPSSPCLVSEATPSEETSDLIESNFSNNENHSDETLNMLSPVHTENTQKRLTQKSGKKRKSKDIDELLALSLEEDMNKKKETKEDDADSLFCRSLIPEFKALSKQDKKRAKVKVLQVLMEFDED